MRAKQTKEGADVVQKLKHVDVFAVMHIHQMVISTSHCCKDQPHLQQQQIDGPKILQGCTGCMCRGTDFMLCTCAECNFMRTMRNKVNVKFMNS